MKLFKGQKSSIVSIAILALATVTLLCQDLLWAEDKWISSTCRDDAAAKNTLLNQQAVATPSTSSADWQRVENKQPAPTDWQRAENKYYPPIPLAPARIPPTINSRPLPQPSSGDWQRVENKQPAPTDGQIVENKFPEIKEQFGSNLGPSKAENWGK